MDPFDLYNENNQLMLTSGRIKLVIPILSSSLIDRPSLIGSTGATGLIGVEDGIDFIPIGSSGYSLAKIPHSNSVSEDKSRDDDGIENIRELREGNGVNEEKRWRRGKGGRKVRQKRGVIVCIGRRQTNRGWIRMEDWKGRRKRGRERGGE